MIFCYVDTKTFASSRRIRIFGSKTAEFGPKYAKLVILGLLLAFLIHLVPCPTNKTMRMRCLSGFLICGYQNFCSLPGCLAQIRPILPQNMLSWAHTVLAGLFGALLVGWLVVVARGLFHARHILTMGKQWKFGF